MIIGSGLLAQAFSDAYSQREDVCVYAAGVSNSSCTDTHEFDRERLRLGEALQQNSNIDVFVYFGTCSVADPEAQNTPYVQHKLAMEGLVAAHPRYLIFRLPQVIGKTPNPHTLLNYLYARISRSESFELWSNAKRNIIDVVDVVFMAQQLIENSSVRNTNLNIANVVNYSMIDIVGAIEKVVGKRAVYNAVDRGSEYFIDTSSTVSLPGSTSRRFTDGYLDKLVGKYYGNNA